MLKYLCLFLCLLPALTRVVLLQQNFKQFLQENQFVLVKFFVPWCPHCMNLAKDYSQIAVEKHSYEVAQVNCQKNQAVCDQNEISGYPTIKFFIQGQGLQYDGDRSSQDIKKWIDDIMNTKLGLISDQVVSQKIGQQDFVVLNGLNQVQLMQATLAFLNGDRSIIYYVFKTDEKIQPFINLYRKDGSYLTFSVTDLNPNDLTKWVFFNSRSALLSMSLQANINYFRNQNSHQFLLILGDFHDDFSKNAQKLLQNVCQQHRKDVLCTHFSEIQTLKQLQQQINTNFTQSFVILINKDYSIGYLFPKQQPLTSQNLNKFITQGLSDKIQRFIDAQRDLKQSISFQYVLQLQTQQFNKTIASNEFVMVNFYSPRCGHCVKFAPKYDQLALHYKEQGKGVIIASVDLSIQQDLSQQQDVHAYPTIKFYIKGDPIQYSQNRQAKDMIKWIDHIRNAKMLKINDRSNDLDPPFVIMSGIEQSSSLRFLPAIFANCPVYYLPQTEPQAIELHDAQVTKYQGKFNLKSVSTWLQDLTAPLLVSLGQQIPSRKLKKAIQTGTPILVIVNKHQRSAADQTIQFLKAYCKQATTFICGYVHRDQIDYKEIVSWLGDTSDDNKLVWFDLQNMKHYVFEGNLNQLTKQGVDSFIQSIFNKEIEARSPQGQENLQQQVVQQQNRQEQLQQL